MTENRPVVAKRYVMEGQEKKLQRSTKTSEDDGCITSFDYSDGFYGCIHISKLITVRTSNMQFKCMSIILPKRHFQKGLTWKN